MDLSIISPATVQTLLEAGSAVAATATVEEATKDAYRAVKAKVVEFFGRPASRALEALDAAPTSTDARKHVSVALANMDTADGDELRPLLAALVAAIERDSAAKAALSQAQIKLDLDVGRTANIENLTDVVSLDIRAKTVEDFNLRGVGMAKRGEPGK